MNIIIKPAEGMEELEATQRAAAALERSDTFDYKALKEGYKNGSTITFQDDKKAFVYLYNGSVIVRFDKGVQSA